MVLYKQLYKLCPWCLVNPILCGTCAVALATSVLHMGRQPIWSHVASSGLVSIKDMQGYHPSCAQTSTRTKLAAVGGSSGVRGTGLTLEITDTQPG